MCTLIDFSSITTEQITQYTNYIFFVLIGLFVLGGIIGFIKGVYRATFNLIIIGVLCVIAIMLNARITDYLYNYDLAPVMRTFGVDISSAIPKWESNIGTTIQNYIIDYIQSQDPETANSVVSDPEIMASIHSLSKSILSLMVYIVDLLIVIIVGQLLACLLYNLIFKFFISKKLRKHHKIRVLGALSGLLQWGVVGCLLLAPFSSLANSLSVATKKNQSERSGETLNNELYNSLMNLIDGYDNSYLAKALVSIKTSDGKTLDVSLMEFTTMIKDGEFQVSLYAEINNVLGTVIEGIRTGAIALDKGANKIVFDTYALLDKNFVSTLINSLTNSSLMMRLIPIGISLAANTDSIKSTGYFNNIDFSSINWEDELNCINEFYDKLYDAGIVTYAIDNRGNFNNFYLDKANQEAMDSAFDSLDSSGLLKAILPNVITSLAQDEKFNDLGLNSILSSNVDDYKDIDWGNELKTVYHGLLQIDDMYVTKYSGEHFKFNQTCFGNLQNLLLDNQFINATPAEGMETYQPGNTKKLLLGYTTSNSVEYAGKRGTPSDSESTNYDVNAVYTPGLLDLKLISKGINGIFDYLLKQDVIKEYVTDDIATDIKSSITTIDDWKDEFSGILDCAEVLINNSDLPIDNPSSIDITNENTQIQLKKLFNRIDPDTTTGLKGSKTIAKILPSLISKFLDEGVLGENGLFGVQASDMDFKVENIGHELSDLVDVLVKAKPLLDMGDDLVASLKNIDLDGILTGIYNSKIINPTRTVEEGGSTKIIKNTVFKKLMLGVFDNQTLKDIGMNVTQEMLDKIDDPDDNIDWVKADGTGEIKKMSEGLMSIINSSMYNLFSTGSMVIKDLDGEEIEDIIVKLSSSYIFEPSLGVILNKNIGSLIDNVYGDSAQHIDFTYNKTSVDWEKEASAICNIVNSIKDLIGDSDSAKLDIDWINSDPDKVENILKGVVSLKAMNDTSERDNIGDLFYKILSDSFSGLLDTDQLKDVKSDCNYVSTDEAKNENIAWLDPSEEVDGEITHIVDMIRCISQIRDNNHYSSNSDVISKISNSEISMEDEQNLLSALNETYICRSILSGVISKAFDSTVNINVDGLDLSKAYDEVFVNEYNYKNTEKRLVNNRVDEINKRQEELDSLIDIFKTMKDSSSLFELDNIDDLTDGTITTLQELLIKLHRSNIFNPTFNVTKDSDETIFEQCIKLFMNVGLTEMSYDNENQLDIDQYESADDRTKMVIREISYQEVNGGELFWEDKTKTLEENQPDNAEIKKLIDVVDSAKGVLENGTDPRTVTDKTMLNSCLQSLSASYLTHEAAPKLIKEVLDPVLNSSGITTETSDKPNYYVFDKEYSNYLSTGTGSSFNTVVEKWETEINTIMSLYDVLGDTTDLGGTDFSDSLKETSSSNKMFEKLLTPLGKSKILTPIRSEFIYKLLDSATVSDWIKAKPSTLLTGQEAKLEVLDYFDSLTSNDDSSINDANWKREATALDSITSTLLNSNPDLNTNPGNLFRELFDATKIIDGESTTINYYSSELVAGFMDKFISSVSDNTIDWRHQKNEYEYRLINDEEATGLEGLYDFADAVNKFNNATGAERRDILIDDLKEAANKMGPGNLKLSSDGFNSDAAKMLFDDIITKQNLKIVIGGKPIYFTSPNTKDLDTTNDSFVQVCCGTLDCTSDYPENTWCYYLEKIPEALL